MPNPGPASTITPTYLAGGSAPDGFQVGSTSQSLVSAYGTSPAVPQRFGANQAAVAAAAARGVLITATVSTVPGGTAGTALTVTANTISAVAVTMTSQGFISTVGSDFLIVNKPAVTTGIGIAGLPVVSTVSTVLMQYLNVQNATNATPTNGEAYLIANLRGLASSVTLSPPVVAVSSITETLFTVTGVAVGSLLAIAKPTFQSYVGIVGMRVAANNTIGVSFMNLSSAPVTPTASELYQYVALNGLQANNIMVAMINTSSAPVTVTAAGLNTVTMTVTGMSVSTDFPLGVSRSYYGYQNGAVTTYAPVAARVSSANLMEFTYLAAGAGAGFAAATGSVVTPANYDILAVPFMRQNAAAPLSVQSVTLTPTAIGALTTAEVAFAVSNITVSTVVWVNKPSLTANIGIVGCRTISANVIGITYVNNSAATITPPAETYVVGNFQNMLGVQHALQQQVQTAAAANVTLTNEVRAALTALGFIAGA